MSERILKEFKELIGKYINAYPLISNLHDFEKCLDCNKLEEIEYIFDNSKPYYLWYELSKSCFRYMSLEFINYYGDKLDWSSVIFNRNLTEQLIIKYINEIKNILHLVNFDIQKFSPKFKLLYRKYFK